MDAIVAGVLAIVGAVVSTGLAGLKVLEHVETRRAPIVKTAFWNVLQSSSATPDELSNPFSVLSSDMFEDAPESFVSVTLYNRRSRSISVSSVEIELLARGGEFAITLLTDQEDELPCEIKSFGAKKFTVALPFTSIPLLVVADIEFNHGHRVSDIPICALNRFNALSDPIDGRLGPLRVEEIAAARKTMAARTTAAAAC